jgi:hypothetical protein
MDSNERQMLNVEQAAKFLDMSVSAIHKLTASRRIPFFRRKFSNRLFFKRADLDDFLCGEYVKPIEQ